MLNSIRENIERRLGISSPKPLVKHSEILENIGDWAGRYSRWKGGDNLSGYNFVENVYQIVVVQ